MEQFATYIQTASELVIDPPVNATGAILGLIPGDAIAMLAARNRGPADAFAVLNCRRLPARLNSTETCVLLGFQEHDIPTLVTAKLLSPLGKPVANAPKYFAAVDILALAQDVTWLSKATKAVSTRWRQKNGQARQTHQNQQATHECSEPH